MSGYVQTNQIISIALAADYTISVADTGKTFIIGTVTGARIMNLPQLQSGLHYRFILGAGTGAGNTLNITSPNALTAYGVLLNTTAATINTIIKAGGTATAQFTATAAISDFMELHCDGVRWYYSGVSAVVAGFGV